ncbi:MAG: WG repeat-containing protein [Bacteroidetes bacterium]|nr:WG repeat-containing protein [Bacteroidota bacterium]
MKHTHLFIGLFLIQNIVFSQDDTSRALAVIGRTDSVFTYGFINKKGEWVIPQKYTYYPSWQYTYTSYGYSEGVANVCIDTNWYFVDRNDKVITELRNIKFASVLSCGLSLVCTEGWWDDRNFIYGYDHWGYVNIKGNMVIEPNLRAASDFKEGFAAIGIMSVSAGEAHINKKGEIAFRFDHWCSNFDHGKAVRSIDMSETLVFDTFGNVLDSFSGQGMSTSITDGVINVYYFDSCGFTDQHGKILFDKYESARNYNKTMTAVRISGQWGFMNKKGKVYIDPQYEAAGDYSNGLVAVKKNGKWGFINKKGKIIIPFQFDYVEDFH